jgi:hypothetical protein
MRFFVTDPQGIHFNGHLRFSPGAREFNFGVESNFYMYTMSTFKRWILIILIYLVVSLIAAFVCFFSVIILGGPHGGALPDSFQPLVLIMGWMTLITVPLGITYLIAKRLPGMKGKR